MMGALIQGLLCFLPYRNIALVAPVVMILGYRVIKTALQAMCWIHNPYMEGIVNRRTVPVFPDSNGQRGEPGDTQICAIVLAARSNSPLGVFSEGYKEVGLYFLKMLKQLERESTQHGFLGGSRWASTADRGVSSELMNLLYFDSLESLHAYAHGPLHTEAMEWWAKTADKLDHIGIMHEVFYCPKNCWEGIYVNYHPTGLGATRKEVTVDGKKVWMNPLVQGRGRLTYSKGRMGRKYDNGKEWIALENTLSMDEKGY